MHHGVPVGAGVGDDAGKAVGLLGPDGAGGGHVNDHAGKAAVADQKIAAAAEDEERDPLGAGKADRSEQVVLGGCFHQPAGGTSDAERGVWGQRNIFENRHAL